MLPQVNREVNRGSSKGAKKNDALLGGSPHSSLSEYDRGWHDEALKPKSRVVSSMKPVFMAFILCIVWISFHESLHYAFCMAEDGRPRIVSLLPYPSLACDMRNKSSFSESFFYYMSPYMVAVTLLLAFSGVKNKSLRLLSYASFFDLQYNLLATTIFGGKPGSQRNDLFLLMEQLDAGDRSYGFQALVLLLCVLALLTLSLAIFYRSYARDFKGSRNRRFYSKAAGFYSCFYAMSLAALYFF